MLEYRNSIGPRATGTMNCIGSVYRARYYDSIRGRFVSADPLGLFLDTNTYQYASGNPLLLIDPLGLMDLRFNRSRGALQVYDKHGDLAGEYPAGNLTTRPTADPWQPEGHGPAPAGDFPLGEAVVPTAGGANGAFGSGFLRIDLPANQNGTRRTGVGVHAGRQDRCSARDTSGRSGPECLTEGCIRTTEPALDKIRELIQQGDRPRRIWIE